MPLMEKRYAEALIDLAVENDAIDYFQNDLRGIVEILNNQAEFSFFLSNPEIKLEVKKDTLDRIMKEKVRPEMVNFLKLLLDKGRIKALSGILYEFNKIAESRKNILKMEIISAEPLNDMQILQIKEKYRKLYNAFSVHAQVNIDREIMGGIKVIIGDKVVDGTVKGRLESLRQAMFNS